MRIPLGNITQFMFFILECLKSAHNMLKRVGLLGKGSKGTALASPP